MKRDLAEESAVIAAFEKKIRDPSSPWTGPEFEWQDGSLGATTPEPHIAFDPQYIEDNDIEVDLEYVLRFFFAYGVELGYRKVNRDQEMVRNWIRQEAKDLGAKILEYEAML